MAEGGRRLARTSHTIKGCAKPHTRAGPLPPGRERGELQTAKSEQAAQLTQLLGACGRPAAARDWT